MVEVCDIGEVVAFYIECIVFPPVGKAGIYYAVRLVAFDLSGCAGERSHTVLEPVEEAELYNLQLWSEGELILQQDSIAGTTFKLNDLKTDINYTYAVQAISDSYRNSEWTESESFKPNPDAISEITESTKMVRIYDMSGRFAGECYADELYRFPLWRSIYLVRYGNGKIKKLLIP